MHVLWLALPGVLAALGVLAVIAAALPARPALGAALDRLGAVGGEAEPNGPTRWDARLGAWVHGRLPDLAVFTPPAADLNLVGTEISTFYRDKTLFALAGLVAPGVVGIAFEASGLGSFALPAALGLPLAAGGWMLPDRMLRVKAKSARLEFARAVAVYLELVAAERKRGAPASRALATAASVGTSWVFTRIRDELTRARLAGTTPWSALNELADEIGVPELADVAKIVRLSGEEGASVADSLRSRGRTLRGHLLASEHAAANQASERMSVPLTFLAFVFVGIVLTPLVLNLLA